MSRSHSTILLDRIIPIHAKQDWVDDELVDDTE